MSFSGSTVISCYLQQNKLFCANVGDSRAIVGRERSGKWEALPLSTDHKPSLEKEADRIRKMKGRVEPYRDELGEPIGPLRVWIQHDNVPGLAMTRSFGDLVGASVGVSPIPEIKGTSLAI
jgi:serine/threonine protein phosphatase PrpC